MLVLLGLSGCALRRHASPAAAASPADDSMSSTASVVDAPAPAVPIDQIRGDSSQIIRIYMYRLSVRYGQLNRNTAFWKLIDEDAVDVPTHAMLLDNGLRVGRAPVARWDSFQNIIGPQLHDCTITTFMALSGVGSVSLDMSPIVDEETLFVLDEHGATGRTYLRCKNQFKFSFMWAPRMEPGTVRVTMCPQVWMEKRKSELEASADPVEAALTKQENIYDLRLCADVLPGDFLILGLSPSADDPNRIGNKFLTRGGEMERLEDFLIFSTSPIPVHADLAPATRPAKHKATTTAANRR
jgi:hypothetical protein